MTVPTDTITRPHPVLELPHKTPRAEARTAVTLVSQLIEQGTPVREIAIVVRTADQYVTSLKRASQRWDLPLTIWTQLPLTDTAPYRGCRGLIDLLDTETTAVTVTELLAPLEAGWVPESAPSEQSWPIDPAIIREWDYAAPEGRHKLGMWRDKTEWRDADPRVTTYVEWLDTQPVAPDPVAAAKVLRSVLEGYKTTVVPEINAADDPTQYRTIRISRAVARLEELLPRLTEKYGAWLDAKRAPQRWTTVGRLIELFATQVPGRREHANARAVDVLEASDLWERSYDYVIVLGLTEGVWPPEQTQPLPNELCDAILRGTDGVAAVVPQMSWFNHQDRDMFIETVTAAETAAFLSYHTVDKNGTDREPSSLLNAVSSTELDVATIRKLRDPDASLPDALTKIISHTEGDNE